METSTESIKVFPCSWPESYPRTPPGKRINSRFQQTPEAAQQFLRDELYRLKATSIIVSTNAPVRQDGRLYHDALKRKVAQDPSVAVYFNYEDEQKVLCCDLYLTIWENIYAIAKTVEAIRAIDRWGVSDFIKRTFTGFQQLPPSSDSSDYANIRHVKRKTWWEIMGYYNEPVETYSSVKNMYLRLAKEWHPDNGGSTEKMQELNNAWEQAQKYFGK